MRRQKVLEEAFREAQDMVWYYRSKAGAEPGDSDPGGPGRLRIERERPLALAGFDWTDGVQCLRWEGRQATLAWVLGYSEQWDEEGAFDS